jgi:hypothetical protein
MAGAAEREQHLPQKAFGHVVRHASCSFGSRDGARVMAARSGNAVMPGSC